MKIIILAGGKGTRLSESAKNIPKPLVEIARKPILQHQIDLLKKHGLSDIRLSLGYRAEQIIEYLKDKPRTDSFGIMRGKYEYIVEPEPLGTGGAIKFASRDLKEDFIVLNGDILSDINLSEFIAKYQYNVSQNKLGAISLFFQEDASDYGVVQMENEQVIDFLEKPQEIQSGYINAGIYILSPAIFQNIKNISFSIEKDIFPKLAQNKALMAFIHRGWWTDAGTEERLREIQAKFKNVCRETF
jgi:NDP-sugar pyrophosphorylase family protein